jgi:hypothetical protein
MQVSLLKYRLKELFLILKIIVNQSLVQACPPGDSVNARTTQAVFCELIACSIQDDGLRAVSIARAWLRGIC